MPISSDHGPTDRPASIDGSTGRSASGDGSIDPHATELPSDRRPARRVAALGLVLGPAAFIAAWAVAGARMPDPYSPVSDAISRTAAVGSPERWLMTSGFLLYAAGSAAGSIALRRTIPGPAWIANAVNSAATVGVALTPLDHSVGLDGAHAVTATTGYVSLALTPLLAAQPLADAGHTAAARASVGVAAAVGACLIATVGSNDASGLLQRIGLTVGDAWLIAAGAVLLTGRTLRTAAGASDPHRRRDRRA